MLSVNPSAEPRGTKYGRCTPQLLRFDLGQVDRTPEVIRPAWGGSPKFTDHSYRGIAADGATGDVLALNIDAVSSIQHWCLLPAGGGAGKSGEIRFPIRGCYPQVAVRGGAGHVLAIGDVVEPVEAWRAYKKEKTGADWDYVFRRLFYVWSPDLTRAGFGEPVEVDTVDATGGHITNLDLWLAPDGAAHLLYLRTDLSAVLRDRFFPGRKLATTLEHVVMRGGRVAQRSTLLRGGEGARETASYGRFHATADGALHVVMAVLVTRDDGRQVREDRLVRLADDGSAGAGSKTRLDLRHPLSTFFTACERGGNRPSNDLDLFGLGGDGRTLRYAHVRVNP